MSGGVSGVPKLVGGLLTSPFKAAKQIFDPDVPKPPKPVDPAPTIDTPAVEQAPAEAKKLESRRRGRLATMVTGGAGVTAPLGSTSRPAARAAQLLGQIGS